MDSMFGAISILILCCGVYSLYAWAKMKKDGHINEVLLLGKNFTERDCKDKSAYMQKAVPAVLVLGVITTLYGAIDAIHFYVTPVRILDLIAMAVFFVVLIWFMVYTTKLKNKYF
ncbi:hypothetical protein DWX43_14695 [Clostridium sp. AF19-22AC]|jgi:hypothetical protein|uniref:DUF3784 domain-containing protein n=1 Tax=Faecalicatena orotica TaxID=1544 RepID=A0A2Y9BFK9_9FIRM|nr:MULTISPECIES: hypothetical protein [Clostridia]PWJ28311.1 hypothetical protein A8806_109191 [Faecalicatena orotica]RHR27084.1 hypothetical protein DWX43_14695 [Clostridium sp. AF19-22AC]SSA56766.1 hypothetical protein SAMN05216536_109191 [Faecalicatena orotica]